jgi:hypothetical protein
MYISTNFLFDHLFSNIKQNKHMKNKFLALSPAAVGYGFVFSDGPSGEFWLTTTRTREQRVSLLFLCSARLRLCASLPAVS